MELAGQLPADTVAGGLTVAERRRQNRIMAELLAHRARALRELQTIAVGIADRLRAEDNARRVLFTAATEGEAAAAAQLGFAKRQPVASIPFIGGSAAVSSTTMTATSSQAVAMLVLSLDSRLENLAERITRYPARRVPADRLALHTGHPARADDIEAAAGAHRATIPRRGHHRLRRPRWPPLDDRRLRRDGRAHLSRASVQRRRRVAHAAVRHQPRDDRRLPRRVQALRPVDREDRVPRTARPGHRTPHATRKETVVAHIDGTLEQARSQGWGHPNCRDKVVAYQPGLAIPQADFQHDREAEQERQEQRRLERRSAPRNAASIRDERKPTAAAPPPTSPTHSAKCAASSRRPDADASRLASSSASPTGRSSAS